MIILRSKKFSNDLNLSGELKMNGLPTSGRPLRFKLTKEEKADQAALGLKGGYESEGVENN